MSLKTKIIFLLFCFVTLYAQVNENRILFLQLKYEGGKFRIIDATAVHGKLKVPSSNQSAGREILFTVRLNDGENFYDGYLSDPSFDEYEYADEQGKLNRKKIPVEHKLIMIRIPYRTDISQISFYKINPPGNVLLKEKEINSITLNHNIVKVEK